MGSEMLRCTQHDSAVTHTDSWMNLLNFIIGPRGNLPHPLIHLLNLINEGRAKRGKNYALTCLTFPLRAARRFVLPSVHIRGQPVL